ncbi:hypothetical protein JCM5296_002868 [Sporobolomyces johnsonii]
MDHSTDDDFVLVHTPHHHHHLLRPLHPFFPALDQPSLFAWDNPLAQQRVHAAREAAPDHTLYLDQLLALAAIDGPSVYPPTSLDAFQSLLYRLVSATTLSTLNLASILYYLVLANPAPDAPQLAAAFAASRLLPPAFALSIRAFHAFDSGAYPLAIRLLSDPRVREPDFVPKTLALLSSAPPANERAKLIISYWRLTGLKLVPKLGKVGSREVDVVLRALCDGARKSGVSEAWEIARQWEDDAEREELMRTVLACCFGDNPTRLPTPQHLHTLLSYPFHPHELALLTSFCLSPPSSLPSSAPSLIVDWFLSRLISSSQPLEALVFWAKIKAKGSRNVEHADERERLLKAVEGTLTDTQKKTLELELSSLSSTASTAPQPAPTPATTSTSSITQPAWAPTPAVAPSTPSAPPRTLAAARLAQLPPAPAPSPQAKDLPLSASPFVRKDGVLRALKEGAAAASPSRPAPGTPNRMASTAGAGTGAPRAGSPFSFISTAAPSVVDGTPSKPKPTLAGFGTVRQPATPRPVAAPVRAQSPEDEEDVAMAEELRPLSPPPAPQQPRTEDRDFARRVAQDPAIRATILAASTSRALPSSSKLARAPGTPQKRSRLSNGQQQRERGRQRGDKRRAVSAEPEEENPEETQDKPDEGRTVKLPPGAFPGIGDEHDHEHDEPEQRQQRQQRSREEKERQSLKPKPRARTSRTSTASTAAAAAAAAQPARRSTRASTSSVPVQRHQQQQPQEEEEEEREEGEDDDAPVRPSRSSRTSRASSLQRQARPEMSEVSRTPVRRSSRLSVVSATGTPKERDGTGKRGGGGARRTTTTATRRGRGKIDEEEEGDEEEDEV